MDFVEKSAKTLELAKQEALTELNATIDEVEVEVIETGSKGFLGIGSKPARVRVTKKFNPEQKARTFLREVFAAMSISVDIQTHMKDGKSLMIQLKGKDMGVLIGKRGQTLDSLQYIVNLVVNKGDAPYVGITIDTENYRQRRKETLELLAINLAKKVKATKKSVLLEPMNPYERRIIHATLQNDRLVHTYSQGQEPYRNVVISPKQ